MAAASGSYSGQTPMHCKTFIPSLRVYTAAALMTQQKRAELYAMKTCQCKLRSDGQARVKPGATLVIS